MRFLYLVAILGLGSCLAPPADVDFDAAPDAQVTFRIGGSVAGMWDGATITLRLVASTVSSEVTATVDANGAFQLDTTVVDGTSYTVTIDAQPLEHSCTIASGEGVIADADVTDIAITCVGPAVDVTFSAPLGIDFDSETLTYDADVSVVVQQTRFTFAAPEAADVRLNNVLHDPDDTTAPWALALGKNEFTIVVSIDALSRTYTINIDRGADVLEFLYAKAANPDLGDGFGASVDIDGDTMVVGAPQEASGNGAPGDDGAPSAGAAYVFRRNGDTWVQEAYLKASSIDANDSFGSAVAVAGDLIAVGAPLEDSMASGIDGNANDDSGSEVGAVYTYVRTGETWDFDAYVKPSNPSSPLRFGAALSLDGTTLAVGTNHPVFNIDGVWVFTRGSLWSQQQYIPPIQTGTAFGHSVSVDGDTLAIGAKAHDSCSTGVNTQEADTGCDTAGAAYVYVRSGSTWTKQAYVKASNTDAGDKFGYWVAIDGDTLVVGAPEEDSSSVSNPNDDSAVNRGAAYVYTRSGTTWGQVAMLKSTDVSTEFGRRIAVCGELIAAGAAGGGGAVTLFRRSGTWQEQEVLHGADASDAFGDGVALSIDGLVVGAAGEDTLAAGINPARDAAAPSTNNVGAVYSYR